MAAFTDFCMPLLLYRLDVKQVTGALLLRHGEATTTVAVESGRVLAAWRGERSGSNYAACELDTIVEPFTWPDADVTFTSGQVEHPPDRFAERLCDLAVLGLRRVSDERCAAWMGALDDVLTPTATDLLGEFQTNTLKPEEAFFISRISGHVTAAELVDTGLLPAAAATKLMCGLRFGRLLVATGGSRGWIGDSEQYDHIFRDEPALPNLDYAQAAQACYQIEEKHRAVRSGLDYYAILEVERRASPDAIRTSYRTLVKRYHPDRHAQLAAYDLDVKEDLEYVFSAISEAYGVLSDAKTRDRYDKKLAEKEQQQAVVVPVQVRPFEVAMPKPPPAPPPTPPPSPAPAPPKPAPARPPAPAARQPKPPPAPPTNGPAVARPTAARPSSPPVDSQAGRSGQAAAGDAPLGESSLNVSAGQLYMKGYSYLTEGDFERAAQAFDRGTKLEPANADMYIGLAKALASMQGRHKKAEAALHKAVELDPESAEPLVELGLLYDRFGRKRDARGCFERALEIDPNDRRARLGLAAAETTDSKELGFIKRFLRRNTE